MTLSTEINETAYDLTKANQRQLEAAAADFRHALKLDPGSRNAKSYLEAVEARLRQQRQQLDPSGCGVSDRVGDESGAPNSKDRVDRNTIVDGQRRQGPCASAPPGAAGTSLDMPTAPVRALGPLGGDSMGAAHRREAMENPKMRSGPMNDSDGQDKSRDSRQSSGGMHHVPMFL